MLTGGLCLESQSKAQILVHSQVKYTYFPPIYQITVSLKQNMSTEWEKKEDTPLDTSINNNSQNGFNICRCKRKITFREKCNETLVSPLCCHVFMVHSGLRYYERLHIYWVILPSVTMIFTKFICTIYYLCQELTDD